MRRALANYPLTSERPQASPARLKQTWMGRLSAMDGMERTLMAGLLLMPFQVVQVSILQPGHVWMLAALGYMLFKQEIKITMTETFVFVLFIVTAAIVTFMQDFSRIKAAEQMLKFAIVYPGFYLVGRWLGYTFSRRALPFGYAFLFGLLAFEFVVQTLSLPVIYKEIDFGQGSLHGTFKERNWLSFYFFLASYFLLLRMEGERRFISFFLLNGVVTVLTANKTALVACGIVYLIQSRISIVIKALVLGIGAFLYVAILGDQLTADKIQVKLEEERGLAFQAAVDLISDNPIGYGYGFVESYFASNSLEIRGLGEGTNSVFAVPLDAMIICGYVGLIFWLVFFTGVGISAATVATLLPISFLSLFNPIHQAESFYLFIGVYVANSLRRRPSATTSPPRL